LPVRRLPVLLAGWVLLLAAAGDAYAVPAPPRVSTSIYVGTPDTATAYDQAARRPRRMRARRRSRASSSSTSAVRTAPAPGIAIAVVAILQLAVALTLEHTYEPGELRVFLLGPLYPIAYWILGTAAALHSQLRAVFTGPKEQRVVWDIPREGLPPAAPAREE
jgi:hypothetical protein